MFLTVDPTTNAVGATEDAAAASLFYIFPNEDGKHPYEFILAFYGDGKSAVKRTSSTLIPDTSHTVDPIPRYMSAPVNVLGYNAGPLKLSFTASHSSSRLTLHSRLVKEYTPIDIKNWVNGKEAFFLNCARRLMKRDGYVCVKRQQRGNRHSLTTACVPSTSSHDETSTWMLFRLLHHSIREQKHTVRPPPRKQDGICTKEHMELSELDKVLEGRQNVVKPPSSDEETETPMLLRGLFGGQSESTTAEGTNVDADMTTTIVTFQTGF